MEENLEVLEMNEIEKMSWELITEKRNVKFDFEKTYFISLMIFDVLIIICAVFLSYKRNVEFDIVVPMVLLGVLFSIILSFVPCPIFFIFLKISNHFILLKDREYQLAKEVILNYENKVIEIKKKKDEEKKRNECREIIYKEKEKQERICELERYLKNERKGN